MIASKLRGEEGEGERREAREGETGKGRGGEYGRVGQEHFEAERGSNSFTRHSNPIESPRFGRGGLIRATWGRLGLSRTSAVATRGGGPGRRRK
eukprot:525520-Pyramimonas_sp.AAC.1